MRKYSCWVAVVMAAALVACGPATTQNKGAENDARATGENELSNWGKIDPEELERLLSAAREQEAIPGLRYDCFGVEAETNELFAIPCSGRIPIPRSMDDIGDWEIAIRPDWRHDQAIVAKHDWPYDWAMVARVPRERMDALPPLVDPQRLSEFSLSVSSDSQSPPEWYFGAE